eukprot:2741938-Alexandrium_andersonii.AAC.1
MKPKIAAAQRAAWYEWPEVFAGIAHVDRSKLALIAKTAGKVKVGTACSGSEAPAQALHQVIGSGKRGHWKGKESVGTACSGE